VLLSELENRGVFENYMESVNLRLKDEGIPFAARPFRAWRILQIDTCSSLLFGGGEYVRIEEWFNNHYGERLRSSNGHRRMLAVLGGDVWVLKFPFVFGTTRISLPQMIEQCPANLLTRSSTAEISSLQTCTPKAFEAFDALERTSPELRSDWLSAIEQATTSPPNFGLSRWGSQQTLEKIIKAYVTNRGGSAPRTHRLLQLATLAERLGLPAIDQLLLAKVECSPAIRYPSTPESVATTQYDAVEANQAALLLCGHVANHL
jgi:hypothetical protein